MSQDSRRASESPVWRDRVSTFVRRGSKLEALRRLPGVPAAALPTQLRPP